MTSSPRKKVMISSAGLPLARADRRRVQVVETGYLTASDFGGTRLGECGGGGAGAPARAGV